MRRVLRAVEPLAQLRKGGVVIVIAVDVAEQADQLLERLFVDAPAVFGEAVAGSLAQLLDGPAGLGHADHGHVEMAAPNHLLEGREDLLVGEVASGAEGHQRIGMCTTIAAP
jgi:hypothetical protein